MCASSCYKTVPYVCATNDRISSVLNSHYYFNFVSVCVYVYCVCACVCIHESVCVYTHVCEHAPLCMYPCMPMFTWAYTYRSEVNMRYLPHLYSTLITGFKFFMFLIVCIRVPKGDRRGRQSPRSWSYRPPDVVLGTKLPQEHFMLVATEPALQSYFYFRYRLSC